MVAFLKTLKSPAAFKTALDDPDKRPAPVEKRDNLDPIENPGMWAVDKAQELWKENGPAGFVLQHLPQRSGGGVQDLGGVDAEMGAAARQGARRRGIRHPPRQGDHRRRLADGDRRESRHVGLSALSRQRRSRSRSTSSSAGAKAAIERGKALADRKLGELNFACTDCHGKSRRTTGSAASGWASRRASTTISRPGAPACRRSGTSASASSGARSTSAPTNCRRTPRNTATSNSISRRRTRASS